MTRNAVLAFSAVALGFACKLPGLASALGLAASLAALVGLEWLAFQQSKATALGARVDALEAATKAHVQELERRLKEVSDKVVSQANARAFGGR